MLTYSLCQWLVKKGHGFWMFITEQRVGNAQFSPNLGSPSCGLSYPSQPSWVPHPCSISRPPSPTAPGLLASMASLFPCFIVSTHRSPVLSGLNTLLCGSWDPESGNQHPFLWLRHLTLSPSCAGISSSGSGEALLGAGPALA